MNTHLKTLSGFFLSCIFLICAPAARAERESNELITDHKILIALIGKENVPRLDRNRIIFQRALKTCQFYGYDEVVDYRTTPHFSEEADVFISIRNYSIFTLPSSAPSTPLITPAPGHLKFSSLTCEGDSHKIARGSPHCCNCCPNCSFRALR